MYINNTQLPFPFLFLLPKLLGSSTSIYSAVLGSVGEMTWTTDRTHQETTEVMNQIHLYEATQTQKNEKLKHSKTSSAVARSLLMSSTDMAVLHLSPDHFR